MIKIIKKARRVRQDTRQAWHIILDCKGVSTVEFAMIAPLFIILVMGIIEVSMVMYAQSVMEGAAFDASRRGKTGYVEANSTREETILYELHQSSHALFDTSKITIDSLSYGTFDQVGQPEPFVDANNNGVRDNGENYTDVNHNGQYDTDMGANGAGSGTEVVVYTITYPWKIVTPVIQQFIGTDGIYDVTARAVIQNEPF